MTAGRSVLDQERNEPFRSSSVGCVFLSEAGPHLALFDQGRQEEGENDDKSQGRRQLRDPLEKDPQPEEHERTVHRMADEPIDPALDKAGRVLELASGGGKLEVETNAAKGENEGSGEQKPRKNVENRPWFVEPEPDIEKKQRQDAFEGEEPGDAVVAAGPDRDRPGKPDEKRRSGRENNPRDAHPDQSYRQVLSASIQCCVSITALQ